MNQRSIVFLLLLFSCVASAQNKAYYISASGNDAQDGHTAIHAWKTLSKVNALDLEPGDSILLEGGQSFAGNIQFDAEDLGTKENPIVISSYGQGRATIFTSGADALLLNDCGGVEIKNLILKGDGSDYNGVDFLLTQTTADIQYIFIDSIDVSGFGGRGLLLGAHETDKGYNNVTITRSSFHNNGMAGIETFGNWPAISHSNFLISYCKAYNNLGTLSTIQATGNGIVVSGVNGGVVEYCEAYNNGANNRGPGGGPVGIWVYDASNVTIQYCESHHNKAGRTKDGGGFDIDGGSQNCLIQYCYSHDNEGPGFAMVEYGSPNPFSDNVIRYNISQDDGRKNGYGALALFAVDETHQVQNSKFYNNTVYVSNKNLVDGIPAAVDIESANLSGVVIRNNIFYVTEGVYTIKSIVALSPSEVYFQNNNYFSASGNYNFLWNESEYGSVSAWKLAAAGQESGGGTPLELVRNPLLQNPGNGITIRPADGGKFTSLFAYTLNPFSPLVDKAIKFSGMGTRDFFGTSLLSEPAYDLGAAEALPATVLPLTVLNLSGKRNNNVTTLTWNVDNEEGVERYELQASANNVDFAPVRMEAATGATTYNVELNSNQTYYRLKYVYFNGQFGITKPIKIAVGERQPFAYYTAAKGLQLQLFAPLAEGTIQIFNAAGSRVYSQPLSGNQSVLIPEAVNWQSGMYFVQVHSSIVFLLKFFKP